VHRNEGVDLDVLQEIIHYIRYSGSLDQVFLWFQDSVLPIDLQKCMEEKGEIKFILKADDTEEAPKSCKESDDYEMNIMIMIFIYGNSNILQLISNFASP